MKTTHTRELFRVRGLSATAITVPIDTSWVVTGFRPIRANRPLVIYETANTRVELLSTPDGKLWHPTHDDLNTVHRLQPWAVPAGVTFTLRIEERGSSLASPLITDHPPLVGASGGGGRYTFYGEETTILQGDTY